MKIKKKFKLNFNVDEAEDDLELDEPRRIRGFVETKDRGRKTFIVDFQLSGGMFYGWTLWDMSADLNGISTLQWILDKDFPEEVKDVINKHLEDRGYAGDLDEDPIKDSSDAMAKLIKEFDMRSFS